MVEADAAVEPQSEGTAPSLPDGMHKRCDALLHRNALLQQALDRKHDTLVSLLSDAVQPDRQPLGNDELWAENRKLRDQLQQQMKETAKLRAERAQQLSQEDSAEITATLRSVAARLCPAIRCAQPCALKESLDASEVLSADTPSQLVEALCRMFMRELASHERQIDRHEDSISMLHRELDMAYCKLGGLDQEIAALNGKIKVLGPSDRGVYAQREQAYERIKRAASVWLLRRRLRKVMDAGNIAKMQHEMSTREGMLRKQAFLRGQYHVCTRALVQHYLTIIEPLVAEKAYTQADLHGFKASQVCEYAHAVRQIVRIAERVGEETTKGVEQSSRPEEFLVKAARRMWNGRWAVTLMVNRARELTDTIRGYEARDPDFKAAMAQCAANAQKAGVSNSLASLVCQMTLASFATMQADLKDMAKMITKTAPGDPAIGEVSSAHDLIGRMLVVVDEWYGRYAKLRNFQEQFPLSDTNFVSEHRELLLEGSIIEATEGIPEGTPKHLALLTDMMLLCRPYANSANPAKEALGRCFASVAGGSDTMAVESLSEVLSLWFQKVKKAQRPSHMLSGDIGKCFRASRLTPGEPVSFDQACSFLAPLGYLQLASPSAKKPLFRVETEMPLPFSAVPTDDPCVFHIHHNDAVIKCRVESAELCQEWLKAIDSAPDMHTKLCDALTALEVALEIELVKCAAE